MYVILEERSSSEVIQILSNRGMDDVPVQIMGRGGGPRTIEEAARIPTDILILDIEAGPGLGPAVLRYRLKRSDTRIILIAAGKKPGNSDVAAVVQAGVYDVVTDISALDAVLDQPPANLSTAAKWLDPALSLETGEKVSKTIIKEKIIEKKVAMSQRPVLIAVAGATAGVGATSVSLTLAAFLTSQRYKTVYIEAGEPSIEVITGMEVTQDPKPFRPRLDVCRDVDYMNIVRMRRHEYIVLDLGAVEPEKLQKTDADLMLAVLPSLSRLARAQAWMSTKVLFVSGDEVIVRDIFCWDDKKEIFILPYKCRFPKNDRESGEYSYSILRSILPNRKRNKVLGFL